MRLTQRFTTRRSYVVTGLGIGQILGFGSTFYLLTVLAEPIVTDTGWSNYLVMAGVSIGLVVAGLGSPRAGLLVARNHGRAVLIVSALLLALGLATMGLAPNLWWYLVSWVIVGLGMSGGLYSAAFAVLGHTYGPASRSAITLLTLFGGFASTICWPLSTLLVNEFGWRWTALAYAGAHLLITAPLYALTVPRQPYSRPVSTGNNRPGIAVQRSTAPLWSMIVLVALISTLGASITALMSVHMFSLLAGIGIAGTTAVVLAGTIGPSQVGARLIELIMARRHHPLWTLLISSFALAVAISFLGIGFLAPALLLIAYGVGVGLSSIAHGTVPLALFGQAGYARIMGRIALPSLLAQAAAPIIGSLLIQSVGHSTTLLILGLFALLALLLTILLMLLHFRSQRGGDSPLVQPETPQARSFADTT